MMEGEKAERGGKMEDKGRVVGEMEGEKAERGRMEDKGRVVGDDGGGKGRERKEGWMVK